MFHRHGSISGICAIFLVVFELWAIGEARSGVRPAKAAGPALTSEQSLHRALTEGPQNRTKLLLEGGANIDARDSHGATPLITASERGNLAMVTLLLNHGAWIDAADHEGNTALHEASFYGHGRCVEVLLAAGAQTSARNALKFTPLHQAVRRFWEITGESSDDRLNRQTDVIGLLLHYGANPNLRDGNGRTPVVLAAESMNDKLQQAFTLPSSRAMAVPAPVPPRPVQRSSEGRSEAADTSTSTSQPRPLEESATETSVTPPSITPLRELPSPASPPEKAGRESLQPEPGLSPHSTIPTLTSPDSTTAGTSRQATPAPSEGSAAPETKPMQTTPSAANPNTTPPSTVADSPRAASSISSTAETPAPAAEPERPPAHPSDSGQTAPPGRAESTSSMGEADIQQAATSKQTEQPRAPEPLSALSSARSMATAPAPSALAEKAPVTSLPEALRQPEPTQAAPPDEPKSARPTLPVPSSGATGPLARSESTGPAADHPSTSTRLAAVPAQTDTSPPEEDHRPWMLRNLGFGLGLGWTHNLAPRRVESVTVVNGTVRVDNERNDLVRFMPEMHIWLDRWDEQRWSWGPFLAFAPGSRVIDAVGFGLMLGYRPHRNDQYSFNFGIGGTLDLDARVLGDGLIANESLPPGETSARTKQTTAAGLLMLFSVGWDRSAPRAPTQTDHK